MTGQTHCPLCAATSIGEYFQDQRRPYLNCGNCQLVFVPPPFLPSPGQERAEYDLHRNAVDDPGYRTFLSRLARPLLERLSPGASGMDFGCGPAPALASMLRESGCAVALYDINYYPDESVLGQRYDFICATEVVEHLHRPGEELQRLWQALRPGGWLGIMTKLVRDRTAFAGWHYKNDPTHVSFFSAETWHWWAARQGAEALIIGADVIMVRRPD